MASTRNDRAVALHAAAHILLRHARRADGAHGLGPAQTSALGVLRERGPLSVLDLARGERVSHATMSRLLSSLEEGGAIKKTPDPKDRRRQIVRITAKGRRLYEAAYARRQAMVDAMVAMLRPETVEDLERALTALVARLGEA